jgi:hypothetical protein
MPHPSASSAAGFTTPERDFIRREFGQHFGSYPLVAEGIFLRTWRGGPQAGESAWRLDTTLCCLSIEPAAAN